MKVLFLSILISSHLLPLERDSVSSKKESTSFNVSTPRGSQSKPSDHSVTVDDLTLLRQEMLRMQTDHQDKERKSRCKAITAFVGGITSVVTGVASAIYAIKSCGGR